jgi:uncharacterized protein
MTNPPLPPHSLPRTITARVVPRMAEIPADQWDACANPEPSRANPFVSHAFLKALEDAETVGGRTGWRPQHIVVDDGAGGIAACAPCYLKSHSQGEYVFDHSWADAYTRAGGRYYPKLQVAVPFTPVPGPRLLVRPGPDRDDHEAALATALIQVAAKLGISSVHLTFLDSAASTRLGKLGFLERTGQQFHWANQGYTAFDDFLATFASRKRKAVRREREQALSNGISIEHVTGGDIREAHWDAMYEFYVDTGNRKWGQPYLNRAFFSALGASMADRCLLIFANRNGRPVAGALNLIGGDCLYGRYWGAVEQHPCLHFEVCYYQAIDYAIRHGLARVEAGAQGEHKLARGYLPTTTHSAHWIADPGFARAVSRYLEEERAAVAEAAVLYSDAAPFRKTDATAADPRDQDHD